MANPAAFVEALDGVDQNHIRITLQAIGDTVGWEPPSGRWDADDIIGPPGEPTPILEALTLSISRGWRMTPANDENGTIEFTRIGPSRVTPLHPRRMGLRPVPTIVPMPEPVLVREPPPEPETADDIVAAAQVVTEEPAPIAEPPPEPVADAAERVEMEPVEIEGTAQAPLPVIAPTTSGTGAPPVQLAPEETVAPTVEPEEPATKPDPKPPDTPGPTAA